MRRGSPRSQGAVVDDVARRLAGSDAVGLLHHPEVNAAGLTRLQWRGQTVDAVAKIGVVHRQGLPTQVNRDQLLVIAHRDMHVLDRHGMRVAHRPVRIDHHRLRFREQVHAVVHRHDARLRQVPVLRQFTLIARLQIQLLVGRYEFVADVGAPVQPAAHADEGQRRQPGKRAGPG
ncbi:hypothetical protein G6F32_014596 [Rhizopus arrhizus]|nr:hypothetical protein G6F32_014596 [Rhizopus arrhizus]